MNTFSGPGSLELVSSFRGAKPGNSHWLLLRRSPGLPAGPGLPRQRPPLLRRDCGPRLHGPRAPEPRRVQHLPLTDPLPGGQQHYRTRLFLLPARRAPLFSPLLPSLDREPFGPAFTCPPKPPAPLTTSSSVALTSPPFSSSRPHHRLQSTASRRPRSI